MITQDDFVDLINDAWPPAIIAGVEYPAGKALRKLDPIRFTEMYWSWVNAMEEDAETC